MTENLARHKSQFPEWSKEAIPLLQWIKTRQDDPRYPYLMFEGRMYREVESDLSIDYRRIPMVLHRLKDDGQIEGRELQLSGTSYYEAVRVTAKGLRTLRLWPTETLTAGDLEEVLDSLASRLSPPEATNIRKLKQTLATLGERLAVEAVVELAKRAAAGQLP